MDVHVLEYVTHEHKVPLRELLRCALLAQAECIVERAVIRDGGGIRRCHVTVLTRGWIEQEWLRF